jgi:hypothetical protein
MEKRRFNLRGNRARTCAQIGENKNPPSREWNFYPPKCYYKNPARRDLSPSITIAIQSGRGKEDFLWIGECKIAWEG